MSKNKKLINQKKENRQLVASHQKISISSSPIPSPDDMDKYENILPGAADRIVTMAEKDQDTHNHFVRGELKFRNRGQIFGFILVLVVLIYSIYKDANSTFITIIIASFVAILSILSLGKKKNKS